MTDEMEKMTEVNTDNNLPEAPANECQPRYKSWALWLSVLGLLGLILETLGIFRKIGLDSAGWDMIVTSLGTVLTAFGIVNNPTKCGKL